ncbi:heavy-metal-associated domain-containing protein [Selenomonas sp. KH1T6]|uniref:heavy-metal-associated domain-containing protein n=1 Tax=Selenomonas sp. KH1T6 TaxID=3158784 RepID=UPI0008A740E2|nr:Copper chaperone CopZ [Selenomonas ruminantium]
MNTATFIVGLVLAIALGFALKGVIKHWRGEGGCCGGGEIAAPPKKELQGKVIGEKIIKVNGMMCGNCKIRVEEMLNAINGAAAEVNLHRHEARLTMTREVTDEEIFAAMKDGEYEIVGIESR